MNEDSRENLSILMDGELDRDAGRFLARRMSGDSDMRATWIRYHMIRDCMRQQDGGWSSVDLCARVQSAIEGEQPEFSRRNSLPRWLRPVAGAAIAASVAWMAVVLVSPAVDPATSAKPLQQAAVPSDAFVTPPTRNPVPAASPVNLSGQRAEEEARMRAYLMRHYQASGDTRSQGFVTLVPIVVTQVNDADEPEPGPESDQP